MRIKELHDAPLHSLDMVASISPLVALLANSTSMDTAEKHLMTFKKERELILSKLPPLTKHRTLCRLNYALSVAMSNSSSEDSKITPSDVIIKCCEMMVGFASGDVNEISDISDVPLENGLWCVELASDIEPIYRKYGFPEELRKKCFIALAEAFNGVVKFASESTSINEERTKNTISSDISARFLEALEECLPENAGDQIDTEKLDKALVSFKVTMQGYDEWITELQGVSQ